MIYVVLIIAILVVAYVWWATHSQKKHAQNVNHNVDTINETDDVDVKLRKLKNLRDSGVIDKVDYEQSKKRILDKKI